jgi:hypothetical protein
VALQTLHLTNNVWHGLHAVDVTNISIQRINSTMNRKCGVGIERASGVTVEGGTVALNACTGQGGEGGSRMLRRFFPPPPSLLSTP